MTEEKGRDGRKSSRPPNITHNSRKTWKTIRKYSNDHTSSNPPCLVSANQVSHELIEALKPSKSKRTVFTTVTEGYTSMVYSFIEEEYSKRVVVLKNNKAADRDDVSGGSTNESRCQSCREC